jgi:hypothetical protein
MSVTTWSNVAVAIESSATATQTVSAITRASPGVASYTGTDPANGAFVRLAAQGMSQVDGRVFRIAGVNTSADTFQLEGENTTNYGVYSSGTFQVITFGTTMSTARGLSASGGDFSFIDVTTIHDNVAKQVPGVASAATYTFESIWSPADSGLIALKAASDAQAQRAIRFTFANGSIVVFNGFIGATLLPVGNAQDLVTTQVVVTMFGRPTVYAA